LTLILCLCTAAVALLQHQQPTVMATATEPSSIAAGENVELKAEVAQLTQHIADNEHKYNSLYHSFVSIDNFYALGIYDVSCLCWVNNI
jgi:hypothetical protein